MTGYLERLRRAIASGAIPRGGVTQIDVEHQAGCAVWKTSRCTCQPTMRVTSGAEVVTLDADGAPAGTEKKQ